MQDMATSIVPSNDEVIDDMDAADTPLDSTSEESRLAPHNGEMKNPISKESGKACTLVAGARKRKLRGAKLQQMKIPSAEPSYLSDRNTDPLSDDDSESTSPNHFTMRAHPDKVHVCTTCGKGLSSSSSLERHLLVHTGQKPFKCSSCSMAFSTNGNMHRHMRTHAHRDREKELRESKDGCDTDDDTDCSDVHSPRKKKLMDDFGGEFSPDNRKYQNKSMRNNNIGGPFKELTFVDFSSEKFPLIAKEFCEQQDCVRISHAFRCDKCNKTFPCESALNIHETGSHKVGEDSSNYCCICESAFVSPDELKTHMRRHRSVEDVSGSDDTDVELQKDNFLAILDLEHRTDDNEDAIQKTTNNNKPVGSDFADIQSILSMTSRAPYLMAKSPNVATSSPGSRASSTQPSSPLSAETATSDGEPRGEEEEEDAFSAQLRDMKLRGEFPCRLCPAVFPNLRALKGHNRSHLGSAPYRCNMCTYISSDKSTVIRHMRIHNGERPFECSVCKYAFTTKANCERHLRNRHGKQGRDEVRGSIIFHPQDAASGSESCTTDCSTDISSPRKLKEQARTHINIVGSTAHTFRCTVCQLTFSSQNHALRHCIRQHSTYNKDEIVEEIEGSTTQSKPENNGHEDSDGEDVILPKTLNEHVLPSIEALVNLTKQSSLHINHPGSPSAVNLTPPLALVIPAHQVSKAPLDLCVNGVLDLSKKKVIPLQDEPEDLSKKSRTDSINSNDSVPVKPVPPFLHSKPMFYSSPFESRPLPLLLPIFHPSPLALPYFPIHLPTTKSVKPSTIKPDDLKGFASRGLQLSAGGSLLSEMSPASRDSLCLPKHEFPTQPFTLHYNVLQNKSTPSPRPKNTQTPEMKPTSIGNGESSTPEDPSSMKMVIKNGVLMKKQKQRRYRTERPFACDFCTARFTLRSNMERHIKQQHPDNWCRRPRGSRRSTPMRDYTASTSSQHSLKLEPVDVSPMEETEIMRVPSPKALSTISDEVRQQLKQKLNNDSARPDEAEIERLVIDENTVTIKEEEISQQKQLVKEEVDLASVSRLLNDANSQTFEHFFSHNEDHEEAERHGKSVTSSSGSEEIKTEPDHHHQQQQRNPLKKKSAYSSAPHKVSCPYCLRKFPWTSSLHRHILTHTGQKPFKCPKCTLWFTTKSNRDRHLLRKHRNNSTDSSFNMRNVPERPYKCAQCPSSTFSTLSNLKKHQSTRHLNPLDPSAPLSAPTSPLSEDGTEMENGVYDGEENGCDGVLQCHKCAQVFSCASRLASHMEQHSELPFKCHLCEDSFPERQDALEHIEHRHPDEFQLLLSKGALDGTTDEANNGHHMITHSQENGMDDTYDQLRGKFPDYANRKVTCAFCMRRFWSAEDLRRHMRTHSGERPFSCNICRRRFTLKHSMLRHRKKHSNGAIATDENSNNGLGIENSDDDVDIASQDNSIIDESINSDSGANSDGGVEELVVPPLINGALLSRQKKRDNLTAKINKLSVAAALSGARWEKDYAKLPSNTPKDLTTIPKEDAGDLISNLLGFANKDIVDELISKSADDAAKLLGVQSKV